jgi:hypothetical protein
MTALSLDQLRFLRLHQLGAGREYIEEWRYLFQGATIRARTSRGRTAAASRDEVGEMVAGGLLGEGWGGSFFVTDEGRRL